jgi:hypothetical protein
MRKEEQVLNPPFAIGDRGRTNTPHMKGSERRHTHGELERLLELSQGALTMLLLIKGSNSAKVLRLNSEHWPTILSCDNQTMHLLSNCIPHLFPLLPYVRLPGPLYTGPCQSPSHAHTLKVPWSISFTCESALTRSDSSLLICHHICNVHLCIHF